MREVRAAGLQALMLATDLLQRARRADPQAGLWEAADVQWWWRRPRRSDEVEKLFWIDDEGPVAGVLLTSWTDDAWQCDPVVVPRASGLEPGVVWRRAIEHVAKHSAKGFEVPVRDDDRTFQELAQRSGLTAGHQDSTAWTGRRLLVVLVRPDHKGGTRRTRQGRGRVPTARSRTSDAVRRNRSPCHEGRPAGEDRIRDRRSRRPVPRCRVPADVHSHLVSGIVRVAEGCRVSIGSSSKSKVTASGGTGWLASHPVAQAPE